MAEIYSMDMRNSEILVSLRITKAEYRLLEQETKGLVLLPTGPETLDEMLTTGKLGNSNRIMMPKKNMAKHNVRQLPKKVMSKIFRMNGDTILLIKLKESKVGIPVFKEESE